MVVDDEDIEKLKAGIKKLVSDINFSRQIIENAKNLFFKNHDANKNVALFRALFEKN